SARTAAIWLMIRITGTRWRTRLDALSEIEDRQQSYQGCAISDQRFDYNCQLFPHCRRQLRTARDPTELSPHVSSQLQVPSYIEGTGQFEKGYIKDRWPAFRVGSKRIGSHRAFV